MAHTLTPGAPLTFEEAAKLDPDETPGEIDRGRWVPVTRGTWRHGSIVVNVAFALQTYARRNPGWSVAVNDPGTKLGDAPAILRGPDAAIIRAERKPTGRGARGWLDGAPDVAVEVMGDDQTMSELMRKALEYVAAGARIVWLVDPDAQQVVVVTPPDHVRVVGRDEMLDGAEVLPGFSCAVAELFE